MDLLLDVNVVVDICARREPFFKAARDAVALCRTQGGQVWMYAGGVQTLDYVLRDELKRNGEKRGAQLTNKQSALLARNLLERFSQDKNWLAALASEGSVFDSQDSEDEQLIRALDRFSQNSIRLLTRDELLLESYPDKTIAPTDFCQLKTDIRRMDFIDLKTQQVAIRPKLERNIHRVLGHGRYVMGPEIDELEQRLADFVAVKHCIAVSSGTDALLIAMMALEIGRGDEVITTPFTFIATGEMIALLGATPVFVDIDPETCNIDPARIEQAITPRTRAIMPVSLYGQCADMDAIDAVAGRHGLPVIEDGAQSLGATYRGRQSCGLSTIGCTSFFPSKPLGGYGDGGACFTNDDRLDQVMRQIRMHGEESRYQHTRIGINGRMDSLQAAILLAKLDIFPQEVELRQAAGQRYTRLLREQAPEVIPPSISEGNTSVYAQYTVQVSAREQVQKRLSERGIPTAVHYPRPLNRQPALYTEAYDLPVSERLSERVISLPMHPYISEGEQRTVVDALAGC